MSITTLNGQAVEFVSAHRPEFITSPVVATVTTSFDLDRDDLVALLFYCHQDPGFTSDATDTDYLRKLIVDTAVNVGLLQIDTTRAEIADLPAGDSRRFALDFCRNLIADLFPAPIPARRRQVRRSGKPAAARALVTA